MDFEARRLGRTEILAAGVEPGEEAVLLEVRHHLGGQHLHLVGPDLAVAVLVDRRDLGLARHRVETPFDLGVRVLAVGGDGADALRNPDMRMGEGRSGGQDERQRGKEPLHAAGTCRGLPSPSMATKTNVPCVTWISAASLRRCTTVSRSMVIEVRPIFATLP